MVTHRQLTRLQRVSQLNSRPSFPTHIESQFLLSPRLGLTEKIDCSSFLPGLIHIRDVVSILISKRNAFYIFFLLKQDLIIIKCFSGANIINFVHVHEISKFTWRKVYFKSVIKLIGDWAFLLWTKQKGSFLNST